MSALPVTISALLGITDTPAVTAAPKAASLPHPEDFLSLLNASGHGNAQADAHERPSQDKKNEVDPQAVAVDAPVNPIAQITKPRADFSVAPQGEMAAPRTSNRDVPAAPQSHTDNAAASHNVPAQDSATPPQDASAPVQEADNTAPADNVTPPAPSSSADESVTNTPLTQAAPVTSSTDTQALQQQWKDDLSATLAGISQILATVIQALTQAANTAAPAVQVPAVNVPASAVNVAPVMTPNILGLAQPMNAPVMQPTASTAASAIAPSVAASIDTNTQTELPLLQDIQLLLGKMQQTLQQDNTQVQTIPAQNPAQALAQLLSRPTQQATDNLQLLTDQLQTDLSKLSQLMTPQASDTSDHSAVPQMPVAPQPMSLFGMLQTLAAKNTTTPSTDTANTNDVTVPVDIGTQLRSGIAAARTQLQKLKNDNEALFAQAKDSLSAQFAQMQHSPKNDTADTQVMTKPVVSTPDMPVIATVSAVQPQVTAAPVAAAVEASVSAIAGQGQSSSDQTGDQHSGSNQQQASAAPVALPGATQQTVSATNSNAPSFAKTLEQMVRTPLVDQVAVQMKTAINDGSSKIRIQLNPAELGKLEIKVNVDANGKTGVVITADNRSTLDLLQRDAQGLARALADAGLSTDSGSLNFNLRGDGGQGQGGNNSQAAMNYQKSQLGDDDIVPANVINRSYVVNLAEGLDISI